MHRIKYLLMLNKAENTLSGRNTNAHTHYTHSHTNIVCNVTSDQIYKCMATNFAIKY